MSVTLRAPGRRDAVVATVAVSSALAVAALAVLRPELEVPLAAGALYAGLLVHRPVWAAVLAVPLLWAAQRLGPVSASDAVLTVAAALGLVALSGTGAVARLRPLLAPLGVYLVLLVPTLVLNPSLPSTLEWAHRVVLVGGAAVVGAWLVAERRLQLALRAFLGVSAAFALACAAVAVANGFQPAYAFGYHKNYSGSILSLAFLVALSAGRAAGLRTGPRAALIVTTAFGMLATQSRGAMLGAALGALVWVLSPQEGVQVPAGRRLSAVLVAVLLAGVAAVSVQQQLGAENVETSSVGVRQDVEAATQELWRSSPWVGVGIRYFETGDFGRFATASNNAVNSELAESGVVGAAGFLVLHTAALVVLARRRRSELGLLALATVSCQLLHGMVDIYWSAGVSPLPWALTGAALVSGARTRR